MKKEFCFYYCDDICFLFANSCVTNYVVSTPTKYKTDANLEQINTKNLTGANKSTYNSYNVILPMPKLELAAAITSAILLDKTYMIFWVKLASTL